MARLHTPIVSVVIGEGGSGGALAIGVCDRLMMLQYSTYSVISPEGCASILWRSADKAAEAAQAMGITADSLSRQGLVDEIVPEPLGGAHREMDEIAKTLKSALIAALNNLGSVPLERLLERRYDRLMHYGEFEEH
jgi:acetyl-CoA carboxylase carboxyl transferase subunit alpha